MSNEKIILIAAVAVGAFLLTSRTASAQTVANRSPAYAARPTITGQPTGASNNGMATIAVAGIQALTSLFGGGRTLGDAGRNAVNMGDTSNSNAGEAEARQYFLDNQDSFAVNPPSSYADYSGTTGGYLDSQ